MFLFHWTSRSALDTPVNTFELEYVMFYSFPEYI